MTLAQVVENAIAIRHDLHRHPELMHEEHRTAGVVRAALDRLGIVWRSCAKTGTLATLGSGRPGKCLAFRADLDALPLQECTGLAWASVHPGVMHACGHDGHTASLLAAAEWLKRHEATLPGPVVLIFQPAEEGGHGAKHMIDDGALTGVDEVYGWHNWPPLPFGHALIAPGSMMASNGEWDAVITGRGGHASQPHQTIDPIVAGASFVNLVQQVVARQISPNQAAVVSVTCFHSGTFDNIIPDEAKLTGTVRAATTELRDDLARRTEAMLQHSCAISGATATFHYRPCYPATVNHPACAERARSLLGEVLGTQQVSSEGLPLMAAEDFGYYLQQRPGAFFMLGSGRDGRRLEPCHSPRFDFEDALIPVAVRIWAALAGLSIPR
jgi:amidohydrolase